MMRYRHSTRRTGHGTASGRLAGTETSENGAFSPKSLFELLAISEKG